MKRLYIIFALLLTSCATIDAQAARGLLATPNMPTIEQAATLTASAPLDGPTATETPTPMPTVDMVSVNATLSASDAIVKQAVADKGAALSTAQSAFETAQSANAIVMIATVTLGAQQLENNQIALESQKVKATDDTAIRTQEADRRTATAYVPTQIVRLAQAKSEAETAYLRQVVESLFWPLVVLCATFLLWLMIRTWATPRVETAEEVTPNLCDQEETRPTAPVSILERQPESSTYRRDEPPGDPEKFRLLIRHAERGNYLGVNNVVAAHCYGSNDEYDPVLYWLERERQYVETNGGKVFNRAGIEFCRRWEATHPCPSPEDVRKEPVMNHDNDSHAEGEYQFATELPDGFKPMPIKRRKGAV